MSRLKPFMAVAGFTLAVVGLVLDDSRVVWAAIACLGVAFAIRLIERRRLRNHPD